MNRNITRKTEKKTEIICNRCTKNEKEIMERKAKQQGKTLSEYMVDSGMAGAERRTSRERKRIIAIIKCQELLNSMQSCVDISGVSRQKLDEEFQKLKEGVQELWEF